MFFGAALKPGVVSTPNADDGHVLHLSQACLVNPTSPEKTYLQVTHEGKSFILCALQKDKCENATLDLFVSTLSGVQFQTTGGKNEVHIVGYFEPAESDSDSDDDDEEAMMKRLTGGMGEDSDEEEEEDEGQAEAVKAALQKMKEKAKADSDDSDDDEKESGEEQEEDDSEDDDDEEVSPPPTPPQASKKALSVTPAPESGNKKRKAEVAPVKPAKQQKVDSSPEALWEKSIVDFLKKNGRQPISNVAGKVKKPETLKATKYSQFLKSRPVFVVEGSNVSLKA